MRFQIVLLVLLSGCGWATPLKVDKGNNGGLRDAGDAEVPDAPWDAPIDAVSCASFETSCKDGVDNDCDGRTDCDDATCATSDDCIMTCSDVEICDNRVDDDCDEAVDCADSECEKSSECGDGCIPTNSNEASCADGEDDDCDGSYDCDDEDCQMSSDCLSGACPNSTTGANAGFSIMGTTSGSSNARGSCGGARAPEYSVLWTPTVSDTYDISTSGSDFDTLLYVRYGCEGAEIGCDDDGPEDTTSLITTYLEAGQPITIFVDGFNSQSGNFVLTVARTTQETECGDGRDNDGDRLTDCADPDCYELDDCTCGCSDAGVADDGGSSTCSDGEIGPDACSNGQDDDCDGTSDCEDSDCSPFGPMQECCDGVDNDMDGNTDIFTCRCETDADCAGVGTFEQTCWSTTYNVCAPRCNFYGGNAFCRMYFPGTTCNRRTGECS